MAELKQWIMDNWGAIVAFFEQVYEYIKTEM